MCSSQWSVYTNVSVPVETTSVSRFGRSYFVGITTRMNHQKCHIPAVKAEPLLTGIPRRMLYNSAQSTGTDSEERPINASQGPRLSPPDSSSGFTGCRLSRADRHTPSSNAAAADACPSTKLLYLLSRRDTVLLLRKVRWW